MPVRKRTGEAGKDTGEAKPVVNATASDAVVKEVKKGGAGEPKRVNYRPHFHKTAKFHPHTILDSPEWKNSQFFGFYVLFWVVCAVYHFRILLMNYAETGQLLRRDILDTLLRDLWHVALVDFAMYILMYPVFFLQKLVAAGYINWRSFGWMLQHIYQTLYLVLFVSYARVNDFTWIAQIFLTLHALVQMMKMHSFAVYNGFIKSVSLKADRLESSIADRGDSSKFDAQLSDSFDKELLAEMKKEVDTYPGNLTLRNFFMYTMFPVVVYEASYPRTDRIRWSYAFRKILATLGVFMVMIVIAQQQMHPVALRAIEIRENYPLEDRLKQYPLVFLEVFPPFMMLYLLTFYIIWDAILNSIAELTKFGDREFYRDWWNSTEWANFARDWNVPVHNFLQRHVYLSSRLFLKFSKIQAMFFTFFFSALVHELAMYVIFGRVRGFLLFIQLTQLPMQFLSELHFFKSRPTLGLIMFWLGVAVGPSFVCSLYLTF